MSIFILSVLIRKKRKAISIGRTQGTHHALEQRLIPRVYGVRGSLGTWWVWERLERTRGLLVAPRFRVISLVAVRVRGTNTLGRKPAGKLTRSDKKHIHFSPTEAVASKDTFFCILVIIWTNRYKLKTNLSAKEVKHPIHGKFKFLGLRVTLNSQ